MIKLKSLEIVQEKNTRGITLISLVVTIIVLLILAGVSIGLVFNSEGLFSKANDTVGKFEKAKKEEEEYLNGIESKLEGINKDLPENTKDTEAGTEVKMPESWYTTGLVYVSTEDGSIAKREARTSSVIAVATGNGETVPVPQGFYYVGGTIDTGVVISDNPADRNKYVGYVPEGEVKEGIPSGAIYKEDGSAKRIEYDETGKVTLDEFTEEEKKTAILGNQFVWIPCEAKDYTKKIWGKTVSGNNSWTTEYEKQTNSAELPQIQKYSGFYVGRYEAGTSEIKLSTNINFANKNEASNLANDNFSIRDGLNHIATGKITSKAGEVPYYHADYETSFKLCNNMYQTNYVQSGLVTGTMWDVMLKFISGNNEEIVTKNNKGNYSDGSLTYVSGKGRYATVDSSYGTMTSAFTKSNGNYYYGINTTAISEDIKLKNIYDLSGNLQEWTNEAAYQTSAKEAYEVRGGSFRFSYKYGPTCYRGDRFSTSTSMDAGFRPVLYIK